MKKLLPAAVALTLAMGILAGCSTHFIRPSEASRAAADMRPLKMQNPFPGCAQIVVTRDGGVFGSALVSRLRVDNKIVAALNPSQKITMFVLPGRNTISTADSTWSNPSVKVLHLTSGERILLRIKIVAFHGGKLVTVKKGRSTACSRKSKDDDVAPNSALQPTALTAGAVKVPSAAFGRSGGG